MVQESKSKNKVQKQKQMLRFCVECLPADKPWDVGSATRRSSGVAPRACVRVYARVLVPPNIYIQHMHTDAQIQIQIEMRLPHPPTLQATRLLASY